MHQISQICPIRAALYSEMTMNDSTLWSVCLSG